MSNDLETLGYWDIPNGRFFCKSGGHRLPKGAEAQPVMRFELGPGMALHGRLCAKCGAALLPEPPQTSITSHEGNEQ